MAWLSGLEQTNRRLISILVLGAIGAGSIIYGEAKGNLPGYTCQCFGLFTICLRAICMKRITILRGIDPFSVLSILSPLSFLSLVPPTLYVESGTVTSDEIFRMRWHLLFNGLVAIGLQLSTISMVSVASVTEYSLVGSAKDVIIVVSSAIFFHAYISYFQCVGFFLVLVSSIAFISERHYSTENESVVAGECLECEQTGGRR